MNEWDATFDTCHHRTSHSMHQKGKSLKINCICISTDAFLFGSAKHLINQSINQKYLLLLKTGVCCLLCAHLQTCVVQCNTPLFKSSSKPLKYKVHQMWDILSTKIAELDSSADITFVFILYAVDMNARRCATEVKPPFAMIVFWTQL